MVDLGDGSVCYWRMSNSDDWAGMDNSYSGWSYWQVGGSNSESVHGIGYVVGRLGDSISVNVRIRSADIAESVFALGLGTWTSGISVTVLTKFILGVVLGRGQSNWSYSDRSKSRIKDLGGGGGNCQKGSENNLQ
jgi:hypothetical protein